MAEAVGTALGAVSLGIEICKGLVWYIDSAKNTKERRDEIQGRMDRLADCLEALESLVEERGPSRSKTITQREITACATAIENIRNKLSPASLVSGSKPKDRLKGLTRRSLYPFKESGIEQAKTAVEGIQHNLHTALAALKMVTAKEERENSQQQVALLQTTSSSILDEQRLHQQNTAVLLQDQGEMIQYGHQMQQQSLALIIAQLSRMETRVNDVWPQRTSFQGIQKDDSELNNPSRRIKKSAKLPSSNACACHERSNTTTVYLRWPLQIFRTVKRAHASDCPFSFADTKTEIQARFQVSSTILKCKAHIALALSWGTGCALSIDPPLRIYRVVDRASPAFKLLASFNEELLLEPGLFDWEKQALRLSRLFQTREASPYDRLLDGSTLLHHFFRTTRVHFSPTARGFFYEKPVSLQNKQFMARWLLNSMKGNQEFALEKDDRGWTCTDYAVWFQSLEVAQDVMAYGVPLNVDLIDFDKWADKRLLALTFDESLFIGRAHKRAIFLRSEEQLVKILMDIKSASDATACILSMYEMATRSAWRRGCELIFDHVGFENVRMPNSSFLNVAIIGGESWGCYEAFHFWIEARSKFADAASLEAIGFLEDALGRAVNIRAGPEVTDILISALAAQRSQLQSLAEAHLPPGYIRCPHGGLPDSQAQHIYDALQRHGVQVYPRLKPGGASVFHCFPHHSQSLDSLDKLYEAGFRDTVACPSTASHYTLISPLLFLLTSGRRSCPAERLIDVVNWFTNKGATPKEHWPGTEFTVFHMIGWTLGSDFMSFISMFTNRAPLGLDSSIEDYLSYLSDDTCTDGCQCSCSSEGCTFLTMLWKGVLYGVPEFARRSTSIVAKLIAPFAFAFGLEKENYGLITEFIRFLVFEMLEMHHSNTCCHPERILHNGDPDFSVFLFDDSAESGSEEDYDGHSGGDEERGYTDDHRVELLERLVGELVDVLTREHWESFEEFCEKVLVPRLYFETRMLRKKDRDRFREGRRRMGVVMESESESESGGYGDIEDEKYSE